jgi:hypothetical protein
MKLGSANKLVEHYAYVISHECPGSRLRWSLPDRGAGYCSAVWSSVCGCAVENVEWRTGCEG